MTADVIAYLPNPNEFIPDAPEPVDDERSPFPHTGVGERGTRSRAGSADRGANRFTDVAALLSGGLPDPPKPLLLTRDDGHALLYAGQVNNLFGDAETGKTWIALAAVSEAAKANRRVVFIDIDHNGAESVAARLLAMGVSVGYLSDPERFRFVEPEDRADLLDIVAFLKVWRPAVAVVDSIGELLPLLGRKSNDPDDFTAAHSDVLKPLAQAGAAVVVIDHLAKNTESRAAGPTGTAAKRRAIGGASIRVTVKDQFAPGHGGAAWLTVNKDRHGGVRAHCPTGDREPSAGLFSLLEKGDRLVWNIKAPTGADAAAIGGVTAADLAALDELDPPPTSVRDVKERLSWRTERAGDALRAWRSRSPDVPREQGTVSVPVPQPPVSGTGNSHTDDGPSDAGPSIADLAKRAPLVLGRPCGHPGDPAKTCGVCIAESLNPIVQLKGSVVNAEG